MSLLLLKEFFPRYSALATSASSTTSAATAAALVFESISALALDDDFSASGAHTRHNLIFGFLGVLAITFDILFLGAVRAAALAALLEQLKRPDVQFMLSVLREARNPVIENFEGAKNDLTKYSVEARDNVRFLQTLERHFKNLQHSNDFW